MAVALYSFAGIWLVYHMPSTQGFLKDLGRALPRNTLRRDAELATSQLCEHGVGRPRH